MSQFGRSQLSYTGIPLRVSADGNPEYKTGGVTLNLATIAAVSGADVTTAGEGQLVKIGQQYLRYGQILTKITVTATQTITITGSPTGGTFTLTIGGQTTTGIAYNASAATAQAALVALSTVGTGNATVTGSNGGPFTAVFANSLGAITMTASGASLTGGTSPGVTIASTVTGGLVGQFGPYDPSAIDGRQNLTRGECFILDETWLANPLGLVNGNGGGSLYPAVFNGGRVWKDRLMVTSGSHSLAAGPTFSEFEAAFPRVQYVEN